MTWIKNDIFDTILVVVDRLIKYAYFMTFYQSGTIQQLAQLLIE